MKGIFKSLATIVVALTTACLAHAAPYKLIDLASLVSSDPSARSFATSINENGLVAGHFNLPGGTPQGFLYDDVIRPFEVPLYGRGNLSASLAAVSGNDAFYFDGTLHNVGSLGGRGTTYAYGISDSGLVVGASPVSGISLPPMNTVPRNASHAFLYDGTIRDLGTLGGLQSFAYDINASGLITGTAQTSTGQAHVFLYDGVMHDLGSLGFDAGGTAINSIGHVAGWAEINKSGTQHALLYDGAMHDLGVLPGDSRSGATDLNPANIVVGSSYGGSVIQNPPHAFVYDSVAGMRDLNDLIEPNSGWELTNAYGINDAGWIVGSGLRNGVAHAFLLIPTPEPSSLVLLAIAMAAFCFAGYHKKYQSPL